MEIRGATIHRSVDKDRKEPPFGYFFAGRIWDKAYIDNLSRISADDIALHYIDEHVSPAVSEPKKGRVVFQETLYGWDGKPLANINIVSHCASTRIYYNSMRQMFAMFLAYSAAIVLAILFALVRWIWNPLRSISMALTKNSTEPIRGLAGKPDEFGDMAGLITRFFEQRQALIETEKMSAMGRFAYGAAHEIKNPLAIIYSSVEYLQAKLQGADVTIERAITNSIQAVSRADAIIEALVKFSDPPKFRKDTALIDVLVGDLLEIFIPKVKSPDVRIVFEPGDEGMKVYVDKQQLEHAFFNILFNAMDAMPKGGLITVRTCREAPRCFIEVADTGEGISAEDLPKVFEPFFTTRRDKKQVGIGLTVAKALVVANDGDIKITSEKGKGAVVRIALPLV
jgi:Signal transduction histidine kinase